MKILSMKVELCFNLPIKTLSQFDFLTTINIIDIRNMKNTGKIQYK